MSSTTVFRSPTHRIVGAAFLFTCVGFYSGSLLRPTQWTTQNSAVTNVHAPCPEPERTAVTVHAPQATAAIKEHPVVNGPPTQAFQDNLRSEMQYITAWTGSGFTNDVMQNINLIYLSMLTQRVPILPFFVPSHITYGDSIEVPVMDFGDVFDVPRLQKDIGKPVLEWWEVKDRTSTSVDPLGCWNTWESVSPSHKEPHYATAQLRLKLDISYTVAPTWIKLRPTEPDEQHMTFASLMALSFPEQRGFNLGTPSPSPQLHASLPPDDHLVCFDNMYWIANFEPHEMFRDHSAAWRLVGQYLRWNPRIEELAQQHVRRTFALAPTDPIPPYITIHARHGDFGQHCKVPLDECFTPLSTFARHVDEVKAELLQTTGLTVKHVIITSDERDPTWWDAADAYGMTRVDYGGATAEVKEKYREWYPLFMDAVIQSGGMGLVGTAGSTVSLIAGHRVRAWHGGVVRIVEWWKPGRSLKTS
ncbi:hypothetical protein DFH06DRAFT_1423842 [Mycena polygramma]|nr:hypothetical protein DFH06DRAFT_1423842 [Mycena polygramma]